MENKSEQNITMLTWIIPVYNGEKYIISAINSITRQPCKEWKIIVIDDGSTDKTYNLVKNIQSEKISIFRFPNGGVAKARNEGIRLATSKYIAFLDADDVICKNAYTEDVYNIMKSGDIDIFSFSYFLGDENLLKGNKIEVKNEQHFCNELMLDPFKHISSFAYNKRLFVGGNGIHFPEKIKIREDVTFQFWAYVTANSICAIDRNWSIYRNNINSVLHNNNDCDFLILDAIPAWNWMKNICVEKKDKDFCDTMIFSELVEYIHLGCAYGISISKIFDVIKSPLIQEVLNNYSIFWQNRKNVYEEFNRNPKKYWRKQHNKGKILYAIRKMVRIPFFRKIYFAIKYKENLNSIV